MPSPRRGEGRQDSVTHVFLLLQLLFRRIRQIEGGFGNGQLRRLGAKIDSEVLVIALRRRLAGANEGQQRASPRPKERAKFQRVQQRLSCLKKV